MLIASDHAGFALKEKLKPYLRGVGLRVNDLGTHSKESCDYPNPSFWRDLSKDQWYQLFFGLYPKREGAFPKMDWYDREKPAPSCLDDVILSTFWKG